MIERNLGNLERVIRLLLGITLVWLLVRDGVTPMDSFTAVIALFLILNGLFSRCYLWYIFDVNTHRGHSHRREGAPAPSSPPEPAATPRDVRGTVA